MILCRQSVSLDGNTGDGEIGLVELLPVLTIVPGLEREADSVLRERERHGQMPVGVRRERAEGDGDALAVLAGLLVRRMGIPVHVHQIDLRAGTRDDLIGHSAIAQTVRGAELPGLLDREGDGHDRVGRCPLDHRALDERQVEHVDDAVAVHIGVRVGEMACLRPMDPAPERLHVLGIHARVLVGVTETLDRLDVLDPVAVRPDRASPRLGLVAEHERRAAPSGDIGDVVTVEIERVLVDPRVLSPLRRGTVEVEAVELIRVAVPIADVAADGAVIALDLDEAVGPVLALDARSVEGAVLHDRANGELLDVDALRPHARDLAAAHGIVVAVEAIAGRADGGADVDALAVFGDERAGVVDVAVFDQAIGAVVADMEPLRAGIEDLAPGDDAVTGMVEDQAFRGVADLQPLEAPIVAEDVEGIVMLLGLAADRGGMLRVLTAERDGMRGRPFGFAKESRRLPEPPAVLVDALAEDDRVTGTGIGERVDQALRVRDEDLAAVVGMGRRSGQTAEERGGRHQRRRSHIVAHGNTSR